MKNVFYHCKTVTVLPKNAFIMFRQCFTKVIFYVRRMIDLMKTAKVNAYIMHIFGKIELLSIHATLNYFKIHYFNDF